MPQTWLLVQLQAYFEIKYTQCSFTSWLLSPNCSDNPKGFFFSTKFSMYLPVFLAHGTCFVFHDINMGTGQNTPK